MTVTIGLWVLPTIITVFLWVWLVFNYRSRGDYDVGILFNFAGALIGTLGSWLIYFIIVYLLKK